MSHVEGLKRMDTFSRNKSMLQGVYSERIHHGNKVWFQRGWNESEGQGMKSDMSVSFTRIEMNGS